MKSYKNYIIDCRCNPLVLSLRRRVAASKAREGAADAAAQQERSLPPCSFSTKMTSSVEPTPPRDTYLAKRRAREASDEGAPMVSPHSQLLKVTRRVIERSKPTREAYLARIHNAQGKFPARGALSCANLAHGFAGLEGNDKLVIKQIREPNIGIVSSYNEMLSAHAPYKNYPDIIKQAARENGGVAQFAGGVPAMCDGVTQGNAGMELSLFSREVIAMSTAVAL